MLSNDNIRRHSGDTVKIANKLYLYLFSEWI